MSTSLDIIVVGAGPAGATAARECAERGLQVTVLDKAEFPRDKPCGGGVNVRAAKLLPFPIDSVVERTASGWAVCLPSGRETRRDLGRPVTYLTQRRAFDALLLEKAIARGAVLRERARVREVMHDRGAVFVRTSTELLSARCLIIADGAHGTTARLAGIPQLFQHGVALETRYAIPRDWDVPLRIELGTVAGGYAWGFLKQDHIDVGVGGWLSEAGRLRAALARFAGRFRLGAPLSKPRAHRLPVRAPGAPLASGRVLLAGDAAGLLDPLTGDGIYAAIESGRLAAVHAARVLAGRCVDFRGYAVDVEEGLGAESALGVLLHDVLHSSPSAAYFGLSRVPALWAIGGRILRGESTGPKEKARFELAWPALALAARVGRLRRARRAEADHGRTIEPG